MAGSEGDIEVEINSPPKSIEIDAGIVTTQQNLAETSTDAQPAMLTGGIEQMAKNNILHAAPQNVKFVMGPNGQLIAVEKPPFVWKDFFIGGGIPFTLLLLPLLIMAIGEGMGYHDQHYEDIELTKVENSTAYKADFTLSDDEYLDWCHIYDTETNDPIDFRIEITDDRDAKIYHFNSTDQEFGYYNGANGTFYFDAGTDYGDKLNLEYEYYVEDAIYDFFSMVEEVVGYVCCLGLLLSIIFLIVGFSQGKPGMGWGGVTALISAPVTFILSLMLMW